MTPTLIKGKYDYLSISYSRQVTAIRPTNR